MKKNCMIIFILSFLFAQHEHNNTNDYGPPKIGIIYGVVIDSETSEPVEYASISIYSSDSKEIITGGITDSDGYFSIDQISPGSYFARIEFIGYKMLSIENIKLNRDQGIKKNLGTLILIPKAIETNEISVTGEMPKIEFETDKMVYTPSDDIIADSGTAEDVLNNVPMVLVDQDGSVSLRGNSNVKILVNGRQNRTGEGGNDVDNIPASLIERIEVITSPSAKYDPEGMAGIINIILKKGDDDGFNGSLKIYGNHNEHHSFDDINGFSISGNYKKDKINLYSSYSFNNRYRNSIGYRRVYTTFHKNLIILPNEDPLVFPEYTDSIDYDTDNETHKNNHRLRLGSDYYINDQLVLNTELNYSKHQKNSNNLQIINAPAEDAKTISTEEFDDNQNFDFEGVLGLTKSYDNPDKEFSIFINKDYEQDNEAEVLNEIEWEDTTSYSELINLTEIDMSYKYPFNESIKIEFGYDGLLNDNIEDSEYQLTIADIIDDWDEDNTYLDINHISGLNTFSYKRQIHGFFFETSIKLNDRWSIKNGLRYEHVNKDISFEKSPDTWYQRDYNPDDENYENGLDYSSLEECQLNYNGECYLVSTSGNIYTQLLNDTPSETYNSAYFNLYPSLHLTYNIADKRSIQFAISERVERPGSGGHGGGSRQIRPFPRDIYTEGFIFIGNPFLEPEYSTQFELSYKSPIVRDSIPMGFFYSNVYYHSIKNKVEWYDDDQYYNSDVLTFRNADTGRSYGLELFLMVMGQTLGGGYWYNTTSDGSDDVELNGFDEGLNAYMKINLPERYIKLFGYEFGFYYMKMKNKYGSLFGNKGTLWANMGFSKSLFDDRARISFNINNLFNSGGFQMEITKPLDGYFPEGYVSGSEFSDVNYSRNGRTYSLTFKVNFGKMQQDKRKFRDEHHGDGDDMDMGY